MPTYEYECQSCGQHTEKFQKMSDEPLLTCPHCKEPSLIQQVSAPAFQLKGTGWYVTDFRDKKPDALSQPASHTNTDAAEKINTTKNKTSAEVASSETKTD